jgi:hypothetical protein
MHKTLFVVMLLVFAAGVAAPAANSARLSNVI